MERTWILRGYALVVLFSLAWVTVGGCKNASHAVGTGQSQTERRTDSSVSGPTQPSATPADSGAVPANIIASPCLSPGSVAAASATGRLLVALEHLMEGFGAPGDTPAAWTWDTNWSVVTTTPDRSVPATFGCWGWTHRPQSGGWWEQADGVSMDEALCRRLDSNARTAFHPEPGACQRIQGPCHVFPQGFEWRLRSSAHVIRGGQQFKYSLNGVQYQPELTRRIQTDGSLHPEQDQSCIAQSAVLDHATGLVTCLGGQGLSSFQIRVPQEAVSPGGVLAGLRTGTLVRIHGHQILRKTAGHWQWDEVPLSGISVAEIARAGCSLPPPPSTVYPVISQIGQEVTFPLVWSSGGNTFVGLRTYVGHDARRTVTPITVSVTGKEVIF